MILDRVLDYSGVERAPATTRLDDLVANLDEIHWALRTTEYAPLVADPG